MVGLVSPLMAVAINPNKPLTPLNDFAALSCNSTWELRPFSSFEPVFASMDSPIQYNGALFNLLFCRQLTSVYICS